MSGLAVRADGAVRAALALALVSGETVEDADESAMTLALTCNVAKPPAQRWRMRVYMHRGSAIEPIATGYGRTKSEAQLACAQQLAAVLEMARDGRECA